MKDPRLTEDVQRLERILIVEDDSFFRSMLLQLLVAEGYSDGRALADGDQVMGTVASFRPDLVLLDVELPGRDGIAVLAELKSDRLYRDIPVIVISGQEDVEKVVACIELGAEDYLAKPFNRTILRARISASLEKHRLRTLEARRISALIEAQRRSQELLHMILPPAAARELMIAGRVASRRHEDVAVLFCDLVGFTSYCEAHDPEVVVGELHTLIEVFEEIALANGLEKIKTVGDAFMAASGVSAPNEDALECAIRGGLEMVQAAPTIHRGWSVRAGVGFGPLVSGVLGRQKFQFDVWGSVVNLAARVVECAAPGTLALPSVRAAKVHDRFDWRALGHRRVKGFGSIDLVQCLGVRTDALGGRIEIGTR